jgi:hypothetical protein
MPLINKYSIYLRCISNNKPNGTKKLNDLSFGCLKMLFIRLDISQIYLLVLSFLEVYKSDKNIV